MRKSIKVAYILDCFPVLSETFIVREILEMKKKHFNVILFARVNTLDHLYSEVLHKDTKELVNEVQYLSGLLKDTKLKRWSSLLLLHFYFLLRNPVRYLKTFYYTLRKGKNIFNKFIFSVFYARKLIMERVGHMHVHFALHACTLAMIISKFTGIPYSFTVHAHDIFVPELAEMLEEKFNNAKFAVCISEYNKQFILRQFDSIHQGKIKIIHCGLNMSTFDPAVRTSNVKLNVLSIGRLVEHKGFKYLIEACKKVRDEAKIEFQCNIIGEGEERKNLENMISAYQLDDVVHLNGTMEQADVINALGHADIFVLPCVTEEGGMQDGIPVVLMESMAMGIPVISTVVSGVPELVRDGAGILVAQKDADGLSKAMIKIMLLNNEEKGIMGRRGWAIVNEHFNIQNEVQKLAELIAA